MQWRKSGWNSEGAEADLKGLVGGEELDPQGDMSKKGTMLLPPTKFFSLLEVAFW